MWPTAYKHGPRLFLLALPVIVLGGVLLSACDLAANVYGSSTDSVVERTVAGGDAEQGRQALVTYGCGSCHAIPGVTGANSYVGPPLTSWGKRQYVAGVLTNEPDNVIAWIRDPQAIVPGNAMPNLQVTDADARNIAAYLYTLK